MLALKVEASFKLTNPKDGKNLLKNKVAFAS